jgi:hypothetical protein
MAKLLGAAAPEIPEVKFTLEQATKAQRGNRGVAVLFL